VISKLITIQDEICTVVNNQTNPRCVAKIAVKPLIQHLFTSAKEYVSRRSDDTIDIVAMYHDELASKSAKHPVMNAFHEIASRCIESQAGGGAGDQCKVAALFIWDYLWLITIYGKCQNPACRCHTQAVCHFDVSPPIDRKNIMKGLFLLMHIPFMRV